MIYPTEGDLAYDLDDEVIRYISEHADVTPLDVCSEYDDQLTEDDTPAIEEAIEAFHGYSPADNITENTDGAVDASAFTDQSLTEAISSDPAAWIDPERQLITTYDVAGHDAEDVATMFSTDDVPDTTEILLNLDEEYREAFETWYRDGGEWTIRAVESERTWEDARVQYAPDRESQSDFGRYYAANLTLDALSVVTNRESGHVYCYDAERGIYAEDGEQSVKEVLVEGLEYRYKPSRANNVISQLKPQTYEHPDDLGGPTGAVCVENGVLDLDTRDLSMHSPSYRFLSNYAVTYDDDAECPQWETFIEEVVHPDDIEKLQEFAGYTLMHWGQPYKKALLLLGPQNSGKSTFLNVIRAILGGNETVASETVQDLSNSEFHRVRLYGKLANIHNDLDSAVLDNTGMFKTLTGGGDQVAAARKHEQGFDFIPKSKLLFAANQAPQATDADGVFYDRWVNVSFPDTVPPSDRDPTLEDTLLEERSGILNWMLDGYDRLREQEGAFTGQRDTTAIQDFWASFGKSVERFVHNCIITRYDDVAPDSDRPEAKMGSFVPKAVVKEVYNVFCADRHLETVGSGNEFTREMTGIHGITDGQRRAGGKPRQVFMGIELDPDALDALDLDLGTLYDTTLD